MCQAILDTSPINGVPNMKVQMLSGIVFRDADTKKCTAHGAGEIIEVSEVDAKILIAEGSAVALQDEAPAEKPKRTTKVV